jgi:hypothetical protein
MITLNEIQHDLRRDFYNLMNLIKFIKQEDLELDTELKSMLEMCLEREDQSISKLDELSNYIAGHKP